MGKIKLGVLLSIAFLALLLTPTIALAQENSIETIEVYHFYGQGCPHCIKMSPFLDELEEKYPVEIKKFEIYFNQENRELFDKVSQAYGEEIRGVPTLFLNDKMIVGYSKSLENNIEQEIQRCIGGKCSSPEEKLGQANGENVTTIMGDSSPTEDPEKTELKKKLTISAVLSAAAVDAINPCAFAVLVILLSTILISGNRKRALGSGLAFSVAIYISYFLMGIGIYAALNAAGITRIIYIVAATLAILLGLFNLKDYLWYGRWFVMEVPMKWRPAMQRLLKSVTSIPGAFLIGFVVSLFLLPCTSGPYIVILGLLSQTVTRNAAILWLLLYNFIFILPMLIITTIVYFGLTTPEMLNELRLRRVKQLHLTAGIILLLLGLGMFIAMYLGII